jgi:hypothetical protein
MNDESFHEPDPSLGRLLQSWQLDAPLPQGFQYRVWRRIATEPAPAGIHPVRALRAWLELMFARPAWSIGYALFLLSAGLLAGYWQANAQTARWDQLMASRYVQSVDPYAQAASQP